MALICSSGNPPTVTTNTTAPFLTDSVVANLLVPETASSATPPTGNLGDAVANRHFQGLELPRLVEREHDSFWLGAPCTERWRDPIARSTVRPKRAPV